MPDNTVYLVVMHSGTFFSEFVRFFTRSTTFSHASISFDPYLKTLYSFGRKYAYTLKPGGFITYGFGTTFYKHHKKGLLRVYKIALSDGDAALLNARLAPFLQNPKKYKYGDLNCIYHFLKKPIHRQFHYTCTSFVAEMLKDIIPFSTDTSLVEPQTFGEFDLPVVYEGYFENFACVGQKGV